MDSLPHPVMTVDLAASFAHTVRQNPVKSLNHLVDLRAQTHPGAVAVVFPEPPNATDASGSWTCEVFDFARLKASVDQAAAFYEAALRSRNGRDNLPPGTVALLCVSGPEFLLSVLGLNRLGRAVLLLAPQLSSMAMSQLVTMTRSTHLVTSEPYQNVVGHMDLSACTPVAALSRRDWKAPSHDVTSLPPRTDPAAETSQTAIILHSSGSSGMPKPIPVPHSHLTSLMPFCPRDPALASFSTTPLFHGGITDLARALAAVEPICFFPLHKAPVTADNVLSAVEASGDVHCFFTVPYILDMLAAREDGIRMLRGMELVSTGGAPLDDRTGAELVAAGVRLVSRYGSSECGFLMSSYRDFDTDKEWSWLCEPDTPAGRARIFEPAAGGKFELILAKDWPHITLSNRTDGGYSTGDLFEKHPTLSRRWKYAGRADDIIVMLNGEKADPTPLEAALSAAPEASSAVVFGESRASLGALLRPASDAAAAALSNDAKLKAVIDQANDIAPSHAKIPPELAILTTPSGEWPTSSKGAVQRGQVLARYAEQIEEAYRVYEAGHPTAGGASGEEAVYDAVRKAVADTLGEADFGDDEDLFALGIASVQATRIRSALSRTVALPEGQRLSTTVAFEHPSVNRLLKHLLALHQGDSVAEADDESSLMLELVDKYGSFSPVNVGQSGNVSEIVLLTGATGALGAHLLRTLLDSSPLRRIVCLCRAMDDAEARRRVDQSLSTRRLAPLSRSEGDRVRCLAAQLGSHHLGLDQEVWDDLASSVSMVVHAAWAVNFVTRLSSYEKDHIGGLHNLLQLVATSPLSAPPTFVFLSSGASVSSSSAKPIPEKLSSDPSDAAPLGYGRSKWVAEQVCARAARQTRLRVKIVRAGQICGDQEHGVWNENEYWPLLVRSAKHTGCLPSFEDHPSWLPIDVAARAIVDLALVPGHDGQAQVFHVANRHTSTSWLHILSVLRKQAGIEADVVPAAEWLERVERCEAKGQDVSKGLLGLWKAQFGSEGKQDDAPAVLDTTEAEEASSTLKGCGPISDDLIKKLASHWR